jgi:hypothetical protein
MSGDTNRTPKRSGSRMSHRERHLSARSSASLSTLADSQPPMSLPRVASITNVLRRMFSREPPTAASSETGKHQWH